MFYFSSCSPISIPPLPPDFSSTPLSQDSPISLAVQSYLLLQSKVCQDYSLQSCKASCDKIKISNKLDIKNTKYCNECISITKHCSVIDSVIARPDTYCKLSLDYCKVLNDYLITQQREYCNKVTLQCDRKHPMIPKTLSLTTSDLNYFAMRSQVCTLGGTSNLHYRLTDCAEQCNQGKKNNSYCDECSLVTNYCETIKGIREIPEDYCRLSLNLCDLVDIHIKHYNDEPSTNTFLFQNMRPSFYCKRILLPQYCTSIKPTCIQYHFVKHDDLFWDIAKTYDITIRELFNINPPLEQACITLEIGKSICVRMGYLQ